MYSLFLSIRTEFFNQLILREDLIHRRVALPEFNILNYDCFVELCSFIVVRIPVFDALENCRRCLLVPDCTGFAAVYVHAVSLDVYVSQIRQPLQYSVLCIYYYVFVSCEYTIEAYVFTGVQNNGHVFFLSQRVLHHACYLKDIIFVLYVTQLFISVRVFICREVVYESRGADYNDQRQ